MFCRPKSAESAITFYVMALSFFLCKSKAMDIKTVELLCGLGCFVLPGVAALVVFAVVVAARRDEE